MNRVVWRRCLVAVSVGVVLVAVLAVGASASNSTRASTNSLCSVSKAVALDIVHSAKLAGPTSSPSSLRTVYTKIENAEPKIVAAASGKLKTDFKVVFRFINTVIADLKQAHWSILGLAPHQTTLLAASRKVAPQLKALKRYYSSSCKFKV